MRRRRRYIIIGLPQPPRPPRSTLKLKLIERDKSRAWYTTLDGKFDVLGGDLNCTDAASRAAGAGPVWSWRPAKGTRDWSDDMHHYTSKNRCLTELEAHIKLTTP